MYDKETGLYYYNARFYDPEDGSFLTQDTYRGEQDEPDTLHLYAYCSNDPVNYIDPSGHAKYRWRGTVKEKLDRKYWFKVGQKEITKKVKKGKGKIKVKQWAYVFKIGHTATYLIQYYKLKKSKQNNCWIYRESIELCNEYYELMVDALMDGAISATKTAIDIVRGVLYGKDNFLDAALDALDTVKARARFKDYKKRWKKRHKKINPQYRVIRTYGKKVKK